jgi:plastocyanin
VKRLALIFGILALLIMPVAALAQYNYPTGPSMGGGGGQAGGGSSGGGISIGSYPSGGGQSGPTMGGTMPSMPSMPSMPTMGGGNTVNIVDFAFQPASISVPVGTTVTWHNTGSAQHTVTAFNGAFDSGTLDPGSSFSVTFSNPGTYMYHCTIHRTMVGTVQVTAS